MRRKTPLFLAICFLVVFLTCGISQGIGEEKKPVTYRTEETWCQNGNKRIWTKPAERRPANIVFFATASRRET